MKGKITIHTDDATFVIEPEEKPMIGASENSPGARLLAGLKNSSRANKNSRGDHRAAEQKPIEKHLPMPGENYMDGEPYVIGADLKPEGKTDRTEITDFVRYPADVFARQIDRLYELLDLKSQASVPAQKIIEQAIWVLESYLKNNTDRIMLENANQELGEWRRWAIMAANNMGFEIEEKNPMDLFHLLCARYNELDGKVREYESRKTEATVCENVPREPMVTPRWVADSNRQLELFRGIMHKVRAGEEGSPEFFEWTEEIEEIMRRKSDYTGRDQVARKNSELLSRAVFSKQEIPAP